MPESIRLLKTNDETHRLATVHALHMITMKRRDD